MGALSRLKKKQVKRNKPPVPKKTSALASGRALAEGNTEDVDPALVKKAEAYQFMLLKVIHSKDTRDDIISMLKAGDGPGDTMPATALQVNSIVEKQFSEKSGGQVEDGVKLAGAVTLIAELALIGKEAGIFEVTDQQAGNILQETLKQYIHDGLRKGTIDPVELQLEIEPLLNKEQKDLGNTISQELGLPDRPTATMAVEREAQAATRPLQKENDSLKTELRALQGTASKPTQQVQPQPQGQPVQQGPAQPQGDV